MPTFTSPAAEFLYKLEPDEEAGSVEGMGWHGLYLGDLGIDDPSFTSLPPEVQEQLQINEAAILFEANGQVEVEFFDSVEEAEDLWEDILDDAEEDGFEEEEGSEPLPM